MNEMYKVRELLTGLDKIPGLTISIKTPHHSVVGTFGNVVDTIPTHGVYLTLRQETTVIPGLTPMIFWPALLLKQSLLRVNAESYLQKADWESQYNSIFFKDEMLWASIDGMSPQPIPKPIFLEWKIRPMERKDNEESFFLETIEIPLNVHTLEDNLS